MTVEDLDELGEIRERPAQPVDLVDDDGIDQIFFDIAEQTLQGGPLQGSAGDTTIVIKGGKCGPALVLLARDIGLTGFPLCIEGIEVLLETRFGGFTGVDGESAPWPDSSLVVVSDAQPWSAADALSPEGRTPKKRGPDQCAPVIRWAIALKEV